MKSAKRVVVATVNDPTLLAMSIAAITGGIVRDRIIADLSVDPMSAITILSPSASRVSEAVKTFTPKDVQAQLQTAMIGHCNSFDPFCPEGAHILKEYLSPGKCVVAHVEYKNLTRDAATGVLAHLNALVEQMGAFVIIFVVCTKKQDTAWLRAYAGEFVEISKCEPGPSAQGAIVLTNVNLADHHAQGIGRVMVEAFVDSGGTYTYRSEPFIAERAVVRLAWCMRNKGAKIEQIAKLIGCNKSNVSRGFENLLIQPNNAVGMKPPKGSRARWATVYDLDEVWPRKAPDAGVADEAMKTPDSPKTGDSGHAVKAPPMANGTGSVPSNSPS
ncbi:hypothetical protein [Pandoraea cepalis]|nr:hypothetical protein [Pandoraea cepalis]